MPQKTDTVNIHYYLGLVFKYRWLLIIPFCIAMAAGIATLKQLKKPGVYEDLNEKSKRLITGLGNAARKAGVAARVGHVGSMLGMFFTDQNVANFDDAKTCDLRSHGWHFPQIYLDWSLAVQTRGYGIYGEAFSFLAFGLVHFGRSPLESRERTASGDIVYAAIPNVSMDFIIYSGTAHQQFSEYRLGNEFASPFEDYSFIHPETTWLNIASRLGARRYFLKNSPQILDFFAGLVARRLQEGRRPLLIAKKCFCAFCARQMQDRLQMLGHEARVAINGWQPDLLRNANVVPLIHYGMIGTNLFQEFDCAYCLTGYYVTEEAINGILQDLLGSDMEIPLRISIEGRPCRRRAGVLNQRDRTYDLHKLAQHALNHLEMDTVLQAVGRVRPYTSTAPMMNSSPKRMPSSPAPLRRSASAKSRSAASGSCCCDSTGVAAINSTAAAPSVMPDAFPAVTVPSFLKTVGSLPSFSRVVFGRGCSSVSNTRVSRRPAGTSRTPTALDTAPAIAAPS